MKIFYYIIIGIMALIAVLLIVSAFPITGNYKVMMVLSGSMEPAIGKGSVVVVRPSDDYKIGEVITFKFKNSEESTTHRIEEIRIVGGKPVYVTKGDVNNAPDTREVLQEDIIGKVLFDIPYIGYVIDFAKRPVGFMILIIVPALVIIFDEAKKIYNEIKKKKKMDTGL